MNLVLKLFLLACGISFSGYVLKLLMKKKISERNSIAWLTGAVLILLVSANPQVVDRLSAKLGIQYPPTLIFLFSTLVLLIMVLQQSIQISVMNDRLRDLAQQMALLKLHQENGDFRNSREAEAEGLVPDSAGRENGYD